MSRNTRLVKSVITVITSLAIVLMLPITSWADSGSTCQPPSSTQPGVHWPTGSDAGTFTYQCSGPYTGEWTNQYYVFNPTTVTRTPLYSPDYSYDCSSNQWYMTEYDYVPATGQYAANRVIASDPGLPTGCPAPTTPSPNNPDPSVNANDTTSNGSSINNTGSNSSNDTNVGVNNSLNTNNTTNAVLGNNLTSTAQSGDALVLSNTTAGDATSGNVTNEADIINMLQSSSNTLGTGNNVITFTDNINGDVNGNLLIDPASLSSIQSSGPSSTNLNNTDVNNSLTVNNSTGASINNNINLDANSGNATVSQNTTGGSATTGGAENIANIVNEIDSAITAGKSFIGTININGNLNGNILLPPDFVNQLLADNVPVVNITGPSSSNTNDTNVNNNTTVTNTNNLGINNSITTNATSGSANVSDNTSGGNATSGSSANHITAFNLTGSNVIGANDFLVFVNVTGTWVGLILNAPAGSTAAEFGEGISSSGPGTSNTNNTSVNNNSSITNTNNEAINNNINETAKSGNALVSYNTSGGNASSGNAKNAVNLLNVERSNINLSGWFGILFINVFGTWKGNFGVSSAADTSTNGSSPVNGMAVFRFMPTKSGGNSNNSNSAFGGPNIYSAVNSSNNSLPSSGISGVLASVSQPRNEILAGTTQPGANSGKHSNISGTAELIGSLVIAYIVLDAAYTNRLKIKKYVKVRLLNR